ncbi:MAG: TonB-dependent receptor [Gemmatimonadetes bacterium]|nr:TonB-dependent receptor [Gemmatimonadota bacterium]
MKRRFALAAAVGLAAVLCGAVEARASNASGLQRSAASPPAPEGVVYGAIADVEGRPVPYAAVRARLAGESRVGFADRAGRYTLRVPAGAVRLRVESPSHHAADVEIRVPEGAAVRVDVTLEQAPFDLPGIVVRAEAFAVPPPAPLEFPARDASSPALDLATLPLDPGLAGVAAEAAAARTRQGQPPADGDQVLLMRGSTADLKLLLLDGAPVYTPFHLGGLLDSFDPGVLGRAAHYVGAAPTRYDGGLDYILDLETRAPAAGVLRGSGSLDLLSARGAVEWGGENSGLLASTRSLHDGAARLRDGVGSPYGYADGLVRAGWNGGATDVALTLFANRESVALGLPGAPLVPEEASWSNQAVSARLQRSVGAVDLSLRTAVSRYHADLPLRGDSADTQPDRPVLANGRIRRLRATLDGRAPLSGGTLRFGLAADGTASRYASTLRTTEGTVRADARFDGRVFGAHGELERPWGDDVTVRAGLRVDHFDPGGWTSALRGALSWTVGPDAVLTLAAGRYHQFTRAGTVTPEDVLLGAVSDATPTALEVATGDHLLVGLAQSFSPRVQWGLQGWVKRFQNVAGGIPAQTASGVDVRVQAGSDRRIGWLGYALDWTWESVASSDEAPRFQGRHVLSAGLRGPIAGPVGLDARIAFSDGLPLTEVALDAALGLETADQPLEDGVARGGRIQGDADGFLRLDVELYGEWAAPIGEGTLRPYLRVLNALDRRDALFYYFEPWRNPDLTPLARHTLWPVLGVSWSF